MKTETMLATEKMLDVVKTLLDEEQPESLFSKILEVAKSVLRADAAVLEFRARRPSTFRTRSSSRPDSPPMAREQ